MQPQLAVQVVLAEQPLVAAVEEQLWVQPQVVAQVARAEQPLLAAVEEQL